jgi:PKHD-type hydroxylase
MLRHAAAGATLLLAVASSTSGLSSALGLGQAATPQEFGGDSSGVRSSLKTDGKSVAYHDAAASNAHHAAARTAAADARAVTAAAQSALDVARTAQLQAEAAEAAALLQLRQHPEHALDFGTDGGGGSCTPCPGRSRFDEGWCTHFNSTGAAGLVEPAFWLRFFPVPSIGAVIDWAEHSVALLLGGTVVLDHVDSTRGSHSWQRDGENTPLVSTASLRYSDVPVLRYSSIPVGQYWNSQSGYGQSTGVLECWSTGGVGAGYWLHWPYWPYAWCRGNCSFSDGVGRASPFGSWSHKDRDFAGRSCNLTDDAMGTQRFQPHPRRVPAGAWLSLETTGKCTRGQPKVHQASLPPEEWLAEAGIQLATVACLNRTGFFGRCRDAVGVNGSTGGANQGAACGAEFCLRSSSRALRQALVRCPSGAGPLRLRHKSDEHDVHGGENVSSLLVLAHAGVDTEAAASSSVLAPPLLPRCESPRCPEDFNNSGIAGRFPNGTDPCDATTTCVHDVFPGCTDYRGDSDSPWGDWCEATIADFDQNRTMPRNIGGGNHAIYYFEPEGSAAAPKAYVLYLPPSGALPVNSSQGRYEYFLFQWFRSNGIAVFMVPVPIPGWDGWDHVPNHTSASPYNYDCAKIVAGYGGMCVPSCDMCEKTRSISIIEAAIDKAAALGYTEQILMGWSSGGAMASAFVDHAHNSNFTTAHKARYNVQGLVLLSSGGQYCYAYGTIADLAGNAHWSACTSAKIFGCCPSDLTEDFFWYNPQDYPRHPPTLLVQSVGDNDADVDAARFYHQTMLAHGATSTHFAVGGQNHPVNPATFGVVASWVRNAFHRADRARAGLKADDAGAARLGALLARRPRAAARLSGLLEAKAARRHGDDEPPAAVLGGSDRAAGGPPGSQPTEWFDRLGSLSALRAVSAVGRQRLEVLAAAKAARALGAAPAAELGMPARSDPEAIPKTNLAPDDPETETEMATEPEAEAEAEVEPEPEPEPETETEPPQPGFVVRDPLLPGSKPAFAAYPDAFSAAECERLVAAALPVRAAGTSGDALGAGRQGGASLLEAGRRTRVRWLPDGAEWRWAYDRVLRYAQRARRQHWRRYGKVSALEPLQLGEYAAEDKGHYGWHTDAHLHSGEVLPGSPNGPRLLSVSVQLSRPEDYAGGALQVGAQVAPAARGTLVVFPSTALHRVEAVTAGARHSLVAWAAAAGRRGVPASFLPDGRRAALALEVEVTLTPPCIFP